MSCSQTVTVSCVGEDVGLNPQTVELTVAMTCSSFKLNSLLLVWCIFAGEDSAM